MRCLPGGPAPARVRQWRSSWESRALAKQLNNLRHLGVSNRLNVLKDLTQLIPAHTWLFNLRINRQNLEMEVYPSPPPI
jgi:hypothetical protein